MTHNPITSATVRVADGEWHVECRFADGQKFAPIVVDEDSEQLAVEIASWLNSRGAASPAGVPARRPQRSMGTAWIEEVAYDEGWNACRNAMLAAAPEPTAGVVECEHEWAFVPGAESYCVRCGADDGITPPTDVQQGGDSKAVRILRQMIRSYPDPGDSRAEALEAGIFAMIHLAAVRGQRAPSAQGGDVEQRARWITQTTFYDPADADNPNKGNCGEAAAASLIGVALPPKFGASGDAGDYWDDFEAFFAQHGYFAHRFDRVMQFPGYYLASGPAERGCNHMVVMRDGQLAHDPHPSRAGLVSIERTYLVAPLDYPAALSQQPVQAEPVKPSWRPMETAPRDGTLLRLLVAFIDHSTEDAEQAPTIGHNNFDNDGEDVWMFAGWCWAHDHFTEGKGAPVGWLPMFDGQQPVQQEGEALRMAAKNASTALRNCVNAGQIGDGYEQYADDVDAALAQQESKP